MLLVFFLVVSPCAADRALLSAGSGSGSGAGSGSPPVADYVPPSSDPVFEMPDGSIEYSCEGHCHGQHLSGQCWCDSACVVYGDCCHDVTQHCFFDSETDDTGATNEDDDKWTITESASFTMMVGQQFIEPESYANTESYGSFNDYGSVLGLQGVSAEVVSDDSSDVLEATKKTSVILAACGAVAVAAAAAMGLVSARRAKNGRYALEPRTADNVAPLSAASADDGALSYI